MNAADFELRVSLPADGRFAETMRALAAHAATYAGGNETDAERYAAAVEAVVLECVEQSGSSAEVTAVLRRGAGPVEFLIACEGRFDVRESDGRITVGWIRESGTSMCRVALAV